MVPVFGDRGPVLQFLLRKQILGVFERRRPCAVLEFGVPADVVAVQVRAHDVVDLVRVDAGGRQFVHVPGVVTHVVERPGLAVLVVANAGVDDDGVALRFHDEAVVAEDDRARVVVEEMRVHPVPVLVEDFLRNLGKPVLVAVLGAFLVDHAGNRGVADELLFHAASRC